MDNKELLKLLMSARTALKCDRQKDAIGYIRHAIAQIDPDGKIQGEITGRPISNGER